MAAWAGFSDDDLRKLKHSGPTGNSSRAKSMPQQQSQPLRKAALGKERQTRAKQPASAQPAARVDPAMMLQHPAQPGNSGQQGTSHHIPRNQMTPADRAHAQDMSEHVISSSSGIIDVDSSTKSIKEEPPELNDAEALSRDMKSLDKFREQQKVIEEANKQKKALLAKTLTERQRKAQAEAHKLKHIQVELSKLDSLLTADVQVIRNKIDDSSRDFLEAQKRYERAEKEFVEAKVDLHNKSELKEQMTEHLYTIIHQNEVRKAQKLAELMHELEMAGGDEDYTLPELPPLTAFQPASSGPLLSPTHHKLSTSGHGPETVPSKPAEDTATCRADSDRVTAGTSSPDVGGEEKADVSNVTVAQQAVTCTADDSVPAADNSKSATDSAPSPPGDGSTVISVSSDSDNSRDSTASIKIGQTKKFVGELEAHVQKELETIQELMAVHETSAAPPQSDSATVPSDSSWHFDGNVAVKQES